MAESKKNILWINYVKALSMICIYLTHCQVYCGYSIPYVARLVEPFYVNSFFFISGYLLFRKQLSKPLIDEDCRTYMSNGGYTLVKNIFFRLVIPSVIFSIIEFVPSFVLRGKELTFSAFLLKTVGGGTYWFTSALAVAELITLIMFLFRRKKLWFYTVASLAIFLIGLYIVNAETITLANYWAWKQALLSMIFIIFGGLYWKIEKHIDKLANWVVISILCAVYVICVFVFGDFCAGGISMLDLNIASVALSLVGTLSVISVLKKVKDIKLLNYIGQNTICFYLMSGAVPIVINMIVKKFIENSLLGLIIVFTSSFVIVGLVTAFINRFLPFLLDLRLLKRKESK